ncbi:hypothetical protein [Jeotgalibacillus proteolyticus]|nr:hypothetical protein [Jeotgalibacillus proteolyticus]
MGRKIEVDMEWVSLINEALGAGISEIEIVEFLNGNEPSNEGNARRCFSV